ncbi:APC membrane recruitment protein 2 [Scomber scombrus]|uniref:APC membrane recruitment protein 2 n=1 Tax=Scomber scombrus TaxID=13677 RepID=UPI002DD88617|nr:APC membrane recruitment protein 2 [Scomber scombrus]
MDVQTENMDPPPCESQPSGKIRKGFKLFGKRKPGNIFSIRSKGDGNNKSPVNRSKTIDGLSDTAAPDSEQELDKEKGQDVNQGEGEQAEEETFGEDGVLSAATARPSISSACSAKSLGFLSLLRGGRRGGGDRRVQTVSQPVGRQRRGLKGLFGNVKFRSKDKEDKEETPPSPLLMSSRANSVEIIKEDLTLTPKSQPRSLDSPETESYEPAKSLMSQDSSPTSPSETITPQKTAGNVSRTNEHLPPLLTPEPPLIPGEKSLSSLLADISSLLTFDSISGGGDIMADVEAEWGKAISAISTVVTEATPSSTSFFSKPTISSPLTSTPNSILYLYYNKSFNLFSHCQAEHYHHYFNQIFHFDYSLSQIKLRLYFNLWAFDQHYIKINSYSHSNNKTFNYPCNVNKPFGSSNVFPFYNFPYHNDKGYPINSNPRLNIYDSFQTYTHICGLK